MSGKPATAPTGRRSRSRDARTTRSWNEIPGAVAAIGAEKLYLVPLDRDVTISVHGTGEGTYTLGVVAGSQGRSVTLVDVPVTAESRDTVDVADGMREVRLRSRDNGKALTMHYGVDGGPTVRAVAVEGLKVGRDGAVTFRSSDDMTTFELDCRAAQSQRVDVQLSAIGAADVRRQRFERVTVRNGTIGSFAVSSWKELGPESLAPQR